MVEAPVCISHRKPPFDFIIIVMIFIAARFLKPALAIVPRNTALCTKPDISNCGVKHIVKRSHWSQQVRLNKLSFTMCHVHMLNTWSEEINENDKLIGAFNLWVWILFNGPCQNISRSPLLLRREKRVLVSNHDSLLLPWKSFRLRRCRCDCPTVDKGWFTLGRASQGGVCSLVPYENLQLFPCSPKIN